MPKKNISCLKMQNNLCKVVITDQFLQPHVQFWLVKILLWFVLLEEVLIFIWYVQMSTGLCHAACGHQNSGMQQCIQ